MPAFLYNAESDTPPSPFVFQVPQTPQSSSYIDPPMVAMQRTPSTPYTGFTDSSQNARRYRQGPKNWWAYSPLDTSRANKFESMHLYELGKNDDSISELDAPYSSKFTSRLDTPNYGSLDDEMTLLKTPSPSFFRRLGLTKPLRKHPFSQWYEVPEWTSLAVHTFFCIISYPVLLAFVQIAKGRTLFWTRLIVGIGSGITGVLLGNSLLQLSRRHLEATGESDTSPPAGVIDQWSTSLGNCNTPIPKSLSSRGAIQAYREAC